ncbi:MAG: O-antigen polymerase [Nitrospirae bacterium]|nr:O-antigen polymerase [Nitrospirota bacterium]
MIAPLILDQRKPMTVILLLFALFLPLSKSAVTVLVGIAALYLFSLAIAKGAYRAELKHFLDQPLLVPVLLPVGVAIAGLFLTTHLSDGLGIVNKLATLPLAYLVIAVLVDAADSGPSGSRTAETALLVFIAGVLLLDGIAALTYLGIIGQRKFTLPVYPMNVHHIWFSNLNAVGLYAALSFLFFGMVKSNRALRIFLAVFLVFAVFSILFSLSRTAWFGLFAAGIVLSYLLARTKRWFLLALATMIAGCLLAYQFSAIVQSRVNSIFSDIALYTRGETFSNVGDRFVMWKAAFSMFLSNPLMGVGTGDYMATMREYIAAGTVPERILGFNQPHNMYLFALATNGLLGLAALLFLFSRVLVLSLPLREAQPGQKQFRFLAVAVAVHYLVAGLTDSLFNIFLLRYTFAFIMGTCVRESVKSALISR